MVLARTSTRILALHLFLFACTGQLMSVVRSEVLTPNQDLANGEDWAYRSFLLPHEVSNPTSLTYPHFTAHSP